MGRRRIVFVRVWNRINAFSKVGPTCALPSVVFLLSSDIRSRFRRLNLGAHFIGTPTFPRAAGRDIVGGLAAAVVREKILVVRISFAILLTFQLARFVKS